MSAELSKSEEKPIWTPSAQRVQNTYFNNFQKQIEDKTGLKFTNYHEFHRWSCDNSAEFWDNCWDFCGLAGDKGEIIAKNLNSFKNAAFFPQATLNYAQNLLKKRDDNPAIIFRNEKAEESTLSFKTLYDDVSRWQQAFINAGITKGDRIAAYLPNIPETITAMLAAVSIGAIWSSASPDFGVQGILDRFGQIEPKILIACDGYYYNGKEIDCSAKTAEAAAQIKSLKHIVTIPFLSGGESDFIKAYTPKEIEFTAVEFNHPLFIMFSSGTTGAPKCIVHGHGGTLIQHLKELKLHCDVKPGDKVFYFTTCGWMMWNWLASALACEATILLFDGSPFYPDGNALWDFTSAHGCTLFGTSAKYIDALKSAGLSPAKTHDLSSLKTITSTGSPLVHESFDYVYEHIKKDVHLASIYGGTDIISASFGIGNPVSPVYRGQLQGPALASDVQIFDDTGKRVIGTAGELICAAPFPSMPVMFWGDEDGEKYHNAYFSTYDNIWHHGDWVAETAQHGLIIYGRSDATLNPGGVRIGTAEIYRQVEQIEAISESICVGQDWQGDVRVILFIILKNGHDLTPDLEKEIRSKIRSGASPRHVPAKIIPIADIPRTKSGKITELAVRDTIMGRPVKNKTALANPESLELYIDLPQLKD